MQRFLFLLYGVVSYLIFFGTFLYAIGFIGGIFVPKILDEAVQNTTHVSVMVNVALLLLFAVQHSVMARPAFKQWWTKFVPEPIERSTYTLLSSLCLILLMWLWQPMGGVVWALQDGWTW